MMLAAVVVCKLENLQGIWFYEQRPLNEIKNGEKYRIKVPQGSKFTIDLPTFTYEPAYWQIRDMAELKKLKCQAVTKPILYTSMGTDQLALAPQKEETAVSEKMVLHPGRRLFTCRAIRPGKITLSIYYYQPFVRCAGRCGPTEYTVKVKIKACKRHRY